jgi:predicted GIY-YIG superfamily endonuclease
VDFDEHRGPLATPFQGLSATGRRARDYRPTLPLVPHTLQAGPSDARYCLAFGGARMTKEGPTSVYLYFVRSNLLLYVGVTSRGAVRQREHNTDKDWWTYVARQQVEHYPTREEALRRERELITLLAPPFNSMHNPDREAREAYLALAETGPLRDAPDKWIPMRVGFREDDLCVLVTPVEYSALAGLLSFKNEFVVSAPRRKVRDVTARRVGSAVAIRVRVGGDPVCIGARLKYRHMQGSIKREIKLVVLEFASDTAAAS